jgi:thioredoxin-like negative regulator of GroEL
MKLPLILLFGVVAIAYGMAVEGDDDEDSGSIHIIDLHGEDFAEGGMVFTGTWFVKFYSPGCGFCKMLSPRWAELADEAHAKDVGINVARANIREDEMREVSSRYQIGQLPGIKLFVDGEVFTLPNPRSSRPVYEYIDYATTYYEVIEEEEKERLAEEARIQAEIDAVSDIVVLDASNFESSVIEGTWLVEFYGPKCGYCKRLAPTWEELAHEVVNRGLDFKVAKIDAAAHPKYTRMFKANPWPSIKMVKDAQVWDFPDPREIQEVESYIDYVLEDYQEDEPFVPEDSFLSYKSQKAELERKKRLLEEKKAAKRAAKAAKEAAEKDEL